MSQLVYVAHPTLDLFLPDSPPPITTLSPTPHTSTTDLFSPDYTPSIADLAPPASHPPHYRHPCTRLLDCAKAALLALLLFISIGLAAHQVVVRAKIREYSSANYGNTLSQFIANTRYLDYEVYGEFDPLGFQLFQVSQQDNTSVSYPRAAAQYTHEACFGHNLRIHNHPYDCPFSPNDLLTACTVLSTDDYIAKHELIVSPYYIYELIAPNGWPDVVTAAVYLKPLISDPQAACANGLLVPRGTDAYISTDLLVQQYADHFGLIYTVTPIEEWNLFTHWLDPTD